jgi:pyrroloquinoline quinone (PQQ) biosynthesis protein C
MHPLSAKEALCMAIPLSIVQRAGDAPDPASIPLNGNPADMLNVLAKRNAALLRRHPFVRRCANGQVTLSALKIFLAQHGKYGACFTRYLCALISNLGDAEDVLRLAQNLAEELGFCSDVAEPHSLMYRRMLADFGVDVRRSATLPGTQGLIDSMFAYCRKPNPAYGLAALYLGAEAIVPELYRDLMQGFTARGVPAAHLEFFRLHIECDDGHAATMRDILVRMLEQDPAQYQAVLEASGTLIEARLSFFTNIEWESA